MDIKLTFLVVCVIVCADGLSTTNLTSQITRNECGKTKLCLDMPKGCDPSGTSQCFFTSVALNNINFTVELSGNSTGYIALAAGVKATLSQDLNIVFVCGNSGGFFFQTVRLFKDTLEIEEIVNVTNIQGSIQSSLIQCVFSIPIDEHIKLFLNNVNGTYFNSSNTANSKLLVFLDILRGSTNGTQLGAPTSVLESSVLVDLANVTSNVVSTPASTTTSTTTITTTITTTRTTTSTTAHSKASNSLTSLLSHVAICFLSIFLHLI